MSTEHTYNLERFLEAQNRDFDTALKEIKAGCKTSHWIWYIFPQLKGLGHSYQSQYFGIDGIDEAKAYYSHPVLGQRLRAITETLLTHKGQKHIEEIMGGSLEAALTLLTDGLNPAVLNMASRKIPGGCVVRGAGAQEECLFRQTNLFRSLYQFVPKQTKSKYDRTL